MAGRPVFGIEVNPCFLSPEHLDLQSSNLGKYEQRKNLKLLNTEHSHQKPLFCILLTQPFIWMRRSLRRVFLYNHNFKFDATDRNMRWLVFSTHVMSFLKNQALNTLLYHNTLGHLNVRLITIIIKVVE